MHIYTYSIWQFEKLITPNDQRLAVGPEWPSLLSSIQAFLTRSIPPSHFPISPSFWSSLSHASYRHFCLLQALLSLFSSFTSLFFSSPRSLSPDCLSVISLYSLSARRPTADGAIQNLRSIFYLLSSPLLLSCFFVFCLLTTCCYKSRLSSSRTVYTSTQHQWLDRSSPLRNCTCKPVPLRWPPGPSPWSMPDLPRSYSQKNRSSSCQ